MTSYSLYRKKAAEFHLLSLFTLANVQNVGARTKMKIRMNANEKLHWARIKIVTAQCVR